MKLVSEMTQAYQKVGIYLNAVLLVLMKRTLQLQLVYVPFAVPLFKQLTRLKERYGACRCRKPSAI